MEGGRGAGEKCLGQTWRRPATRGCNKGGALQRGGERGGGGREGGGFAEPYPGARGMPPSPVPK